MPANRFVPLPHEWMLIAIIGFFITVFMVWDASKTWGFTLAVFFLIMFIASIVSISGAGLSEEELAELAIHEPSVRAGRHRREARK